MAERQKIHELLGLRTEWMGRAACHNVSPDIFFPNSDKDPKTEAAKKVCQGCEVRVECLDYALKNHIEHGVWGGCSEQERIDLRRGLANRRALNS